MSGSRIDLIFRNMRNSADVRIEPLEDGHAPVIDGRMAITPKGAPLAAPTLALATAIAEEWRAAGGHPSIKSMVLTRMAVATVDSDESRRNAWRSAIIGFAASDLICYRAAGPADLVRRQTELWDPVLDWCEAAYGVRLATTKGVAPQPQTPSGLEKIAASLAQRDGWRLCGLVRATQLTGSAVLALALEAEAFPAQRLLEASRLDEDFQTERWGVDPEASARAGEIEIEFRAVSRWFRALAPEGDGLAI